jgi:hypothetical protein
MWSIVWDGYFGGSGEGEGRAKRGEKFSPILVQTEKHPKSKISKTPSRKGIYIELVQLEQLRIPQKSRPKLAELYRWIEWAAN